MSWFFFSFPFSFLQLSSKLIEESRIDERDSLLNQLDKQHQQQRLALTAELDAEDAEHKRQLTQAMDEDHTGTLRNIHHDLNTQVDCYYLVALFFLNNVLKKVYQGQLLIRSEICSVARFMKHSQKIYGYFTFSPKKW